MLSQTSKLISGILAALPVLVAFTVSVGLIYTINQQSLRQNANDPQIQLSQDAASHLSTGVNPEALIGSKVDPSQSLSPFLIIYNRDGQVLSSEVTLQGSTPALPSGVFDYTKQNGSDRFTWQPQDGVRIAAVVVPYQGENKGFVLAGRSLKEVEKRENQLLLLSTLGWLVGVSLIIITSFANKTYTGK